jgi:hypothetical protein
MRSVFLHLQVLFGACSLVIATAPAAPQRLDNSPLPLQPQPGLSPTVLVKGAWSSAGDSVGPLPEGGRVIDSMYSNDYFGLTYRLSPKWVEGYSGPPPSDSGYYVLAQIESAADLKSMNPGHLLIAAQDMFFAPVPAESALDLINYSKDHLAADYKVERPPIEVQIANHTFVRFDYLSPVAQLHWRVLATEIRCHTVQFIFTGHDTRLIESLIEAMNTMRLPLEAGSTSRRSAGDFPICIKDYARDENLIEREDPIFTERRFNPVPVRIVIDKEGKVKHLHFLSAFPDQVKSISDALSQWRFKPYLVEGQPVEVETGLMFGRAPHATSPSLSTKAKERLPLSPDPIP